MGQDLDADRNNVVSRNARWAMRERSARRIGFGRGLGCQGAPAKVREFPIRHSGLRQAAGLAGSNLGMPSLPAARPAAVAVDIEARGDRLKPPKVRSVPHSPTTTATAVPVTTDVEDPLEGLHVVLGEGLEALLHAALRREMTASWRRSRGLQAGSCPNDDHRAPVRKQGSHFLGSVPLCGRFSSENERLECMAEVGTRTSSWRTKNAGIVQLRGGRNLFPLRMFSRAGFRREAETDAFEEARRPPRRPARSSPAERRQAR
jgi:hypothetical protein